MRHSINIYLTIISILFLISCGENDEAGKKLQTKPGEKQKTETKAAKSKKKIKTHKKAPQQEVFKSIDDLLINAMLKSSLITKEALKNKLDSPEIILIDVRQPELFRLGNIPNSVNIPRGELEFQIFAKFPDLEKDKEIILYDRMGNNQAPLSAEQLMRIGFTNVFILEGGWKNWSQKQKTIQAKDSTKKSE